MEFDVENGLIRIPRACKDVNLKGADTTKAM